MHRSSSKTKQYQIDKNGERDLQAETLRILNLKINNLRIFKKSKNWIYKKLKAANQKIPKS